jgi:hypothetical protein
MKEIDNMKQDAVIVKKSPKFILYKDTSCYRLEIYNSRLSSLVNKILRQYTDDTVFRIGEEALFKLNEHQVNQLSASLLNKEEWG